MERDASVDAYKAELVRLRMTEQRIVQAVCDGFANESLKEKSLKTDARIKELTRLLSSEKEAPILLHPRMADRYRQEVTGLIGALKDDKHGHDARQLIRSLVDKITLTPDPESEAVLVSLHGDLAGILRVATGRRDVENELDLRQIKLVVGLDNPPSTRRRARDGGKLVAHAVACEPVSGTQFPDLREKTGIIRSLPKSSRQGAFISLDIAGAFLRFPYAENREFFRTLQGTATPDGQ